ncbi:DNA mismatch repair protein mutL [Haploplasma axanthum]|uniref:DNA mismatch repair protein MutL n=2 Tax=Haploplasma axanthum TaxID=29552 RepID=A0A449BE36_HAPAX|nr:DNA mismatch repair protein mutL [Haploplasma axanthum]
MSIIKQMDERLANMIAAGEVVERPASIVKELVENSIDAKATEINIFIKENGLKEIRVVDNGIGMDNEDAKKAFLRHATSKIKTEFDLERIRTLGFRGEALAAILSVSRITLKTRQSNSEGFFVRYEDSKLIDEGTTSLNEGTEITVNDLFYNTPARLKYIKSEFSERAAIIDMFDRLALSNPTVRLSLTIDEKLVKETYGNNDYYSLMRQVYGNNVLKDLIVFEKEFQKIKIKGYLASPSVSRARKKDISLFVNGRYIMNYGLTQSIIDGYHSFLMVNRYPLAILLIEMDPVLLDVNVHPQKLEVKFANESLLKYHIELFVKESLMSRPHEIPQNLSIIKRQEYENEPVTINESFIPRKETYVKESLDFVYNDNSNKQTEEQPEIKKIPDFSYVGTFAGTYLLFQNEQGMYMIDQHAAEERVNYEYYFDVIGNPKIVIKEMFLSRNLELTNEDLNLIKNHLNDFKELGFNFNEKMQLISHPTFLLDKDLDDAISVMLQMLEEKNQIDLKILLDNLAKSKSCKASIKANDTLSRKEIDVLIEKLRKTKNPYTCPHGRPTIIHLTYYEIERMFRRVVWWKKLLLLLDQLHQEKRCIQ